VDSHSSALLGLAQLAFLGVYFAPFFIALGQSHPQKLALFFINLLFGWTIIGWLLALAWAFAGKSLAAAAAARAAERAAELRREADAAEAAREAKEAFKATRHKYWAVNECTFRGRTALFGIKKDNSAIGVVTYRLDDDEFQPGTSLEVPVGMVLSAKVERDDVRETFYRNEVVPVAINNRKSSVGRALVGGALLGPAGVVMGAASGLGGRSDIITKTQKVADERIVKGPPLLVIGTATNGVLHISFAVESHAEHWANQIQAARFALGLPLLV
jgi:hypothetical protein